MKIKKSTVLGFGRYTGWTAAQILERDPGYLLWMHRNVEGHRLGTKLLGQVLDRMPVASWGPEPRTYYFADGSGYVEARGPCGPLYFDRNGDT